MLSLAALAWHAFPGWWQDRLVRKGQSFLERGDTRGAFLSAHEALNRNPACVPAVELMAQLCLRGQSPEEIFWRQRLVTLQPQDAARQVQLAEAAIRFGEAFAAKHALAAVPEKERTAGYYRAAATLALSSGQLGQAEEHLEAANRWQPENGAVRLMLAKLRLGSPEPKKRAQAHEQLRGFTADNALRLEAEQALLGEARAQGRFDEARQIAQTIRALPEATVSDGLAYLEELDRVKKQATSDDLQALKFENELHQIEERAKFDGPSIFALASWMYGHGYAEENRVWLEALPATQKALPSTLLIEANTSVMLKNWAEVKALASRANWGGLEYLRLAFLAHWALEQKGARDAGFSEAWLKARQAVGTDRDKIKTLASLTEGWGWKAEPKELWWELAKSPHGALAALQHLFALCRQQGASEELLRVSESIYRLDPGNLIGSNNFAQLSLLLRHRSAEIDTIARENARQHPHDWALCSTYAFSLHLQGRNREAIDLMLQLPGAPQRDPQMAAYFGLCYAASGEAERARPLLELALDGNLLPEEAILVHTALLR